MLNSIGPKYSARWGDVSSEEWVGGEENGILLRRSPVSFVGTRMMILYRYALSHGQNESGYEYAC